MPDGDDQGFVLLVGGESNVYVRRNVKRELMGLRV